MLTTKLCNKTYEEIIRKLKLLSLENRKHRDRLIEVFKILNGFDNIKF